jgi:hypothetical protein
MGARKPNELETEMMKNPIARMTAAALVVATAMALSPASARAESSHFNQIPQVHNADYRHQQGGYRDRNRYSGHAQRHRPYWYGKRICEPRQAVHKASRLGMRRPGIRRVTRSEIVVAGHNYGRRALVVFDRFSPHCRIVSARGI